MTWRECQGLMHEIWSLKCRLEAQSEAIPMEFLEADCEAEHVLAAHGM